MSLTTIEYAELGALASVLAHAPRCYECEGPATRLRDVQTKDASTWCDVHNDNPDEGSPLELPNAVLVRRFAELLGRAREEAQSPARLSRESELAALSALVANMPAFCHCGLPATKGNPGTERKMTCDAHAEPYFRELSQTPIARRFAALLGDIAR